MNAAAIPAASPLASAGDTAVAARQVITCTLDGKEYGIDIMAVQEIKCWSETTAIPHAPAWVRGVINLRGVIVPILDLRARFGMALTVTTPTHVVVIVQAGTRTMGVLVDAVSDIVAITPADIHAVPDMGGNPQERLLSGLVPLERGMVSIVALDVLTDIAGDIPAAAASLH